MKEIKIEEINKSVFELVGKDWMLIAAKDKSGRVNAMTASWGGMGELWGKHVAFIFVRPQRFTRKLIDNASTLSLSFFAEHHRAMLTYMGRASGADEDKIAHAKLTVGDIDGAPVFEQSALTLVCEKLYCQQLTPESFANNATAEKWYKNNDFHYMYIAEIKSILENK